SSLLTRFILLSADTAPAEISTLSLHDALPIWIGAELLEECHFLFKLVQCFAHVGIIAMAQHIHVEVVLPLTRAGRARFKTRHGNPIVRQGRQHGIHSPGTAWNGQNNAGLVISGRQSFNLAHGPEARTVLRVALNTRGYGRKVPGTRRLVACSRCDAWIL